MGSIFIFASGIAIGAVFGAPLKPFVIQYSKKAWAFVKSKVGGNG